MDKHIKDMIYMLRHAYIELTKILKDANMIQPEMTASEMIIDMLDDMIVRERKEWRGLRDAQA